MRASFGEIAESLFPPMVATAGYVCSQCALWVMAALDWINVTKLIESVASHDLVIFWAGILAGWYAGINWRRKKRVIDGKSAKQERQGSAQSGTEKGGGIDGRNPES